MNLFYMLADTTEVCNTLVPIMTILGYVIFGIKIVVPVILIVVGMMDLSKAIMSKKDDEIKAAQSSLIKKIVVAVCVYLVITIVSLVVQLIGAGTDWKDCAKCALDPNNSECYVMQP